MDGYDICGVDSVVVEMKDEALERLIEDLKPITKRCEIPFEPYDDYGYCDHCDRYGRVRVEENRQLCRSCASK